MELTITTPFSTAMPKSAMNPIDGGEAQVEAGDPERRHAADEREGDVGEHESRLPHPLEGGEEEQVDREDGERNERSRAAGAPCAGACTGRPTHTR